MDITEFNNYMVNIHLVPSLNEYKFSFHTYVNPKIFLQEYDNFNYTPWKIAKDRFGGIVCLNESINIYEYQHPFVFNKNLFGKFISDPRNNFISYIGFFKNIFSINKEYKKFKHDIISILNKNNIHDDELKNQILSYQFKK